MIFVPASELSSADLASLGGNVRAAVLRERRISRSPFGHLGHLGHLSRHAAGRRRSRRHRGRGHRRSRHDGPQGMSAIEVGPLAPTGGLCQVAASPPPAVVA